MGKGFPLVPVTKHSYSTSQTFQATLLEKKNNEPSYTHALFLFSKVAMLNYKDKRKTLAHRLSLHRYFQKREGRLIRL